VQPGRVLLAASRSTPDEIVHLQVKSGGTVVYQGKVYGDRATLQVRRGDRGQVDGPVAEIDPNEVPDVGSISA
jgi:hypothetical protein